MLSWVMAKNVGDVFFETQCISVNDADICVKFDIQIGLIQNMQN